MHRSAKRSALTLKILYTIYRTHCVNLNLIFGQRYKIVVLYHSIFGIYTQRVISKFEYEIKIHGIQVMIYIFSDMKSSFIVPCGPCRQFMVEVSLLIEKSQSLLYIYICM